MLFKQRLLVRIAIFASLILVTGLARAEYYMYYPEPPISSVMKYKSPGYDHKMKKYYQSKYHKSRHRHDIEVTYYWPICPGCACSNSRYCYPNDEQLNNVAVMGNGGGAIYFRAQPMNKRSTRMLRNDDTFDMRTADDDVMRNPNMNNQYNQF